jgi:hypothetical protein
VRLSFNRLRLYWRALGRAFASPTAKQSEAYARYCHTLSAALLLAGGAIPLTVNQVTLPVILRVVGACVLALLLFVWGVILLEDR